MEGQCQSSLQTQVWVLRAYCNLLLVSFSVLYLGLDLSFLPLISSRLLKISTSFSVLIACNLSKPDNTFSNFILLYFFSPQKVYFPAFAPLSLAEFARRKKTVLSDLVQLEQKESSATIACID